LHISVYKYFSVRPWNWISRIPNWLYCFSEKKSGWRYITQVL